MKHCKQHGRQFCWFCVGTTFGFPLEHAIWEKLPGLSWVMVALGLS